jgi:hypothetical protein
MLIRIMGTITFAIDRRTAGEKLIFKPVKSHIAIAKRSYLQLHTLCNEAHQSIKPSYIT